MECRHNGFRSVSSSYSGHAGLLVYYWVCDRCGARLDEIQRERYRPAYDPHGNDPFLAVGGLAPQA
jgi:hypothetical protein